LASVLEHGRKWHPPEARRRRLTGVRNAWPLLCRMAGGEPIPIVVKHLRQVFCDFLIVEDEAGISVRFDALVRPIMTAEDDPLAVHDNCFVVAGMLKAERLTRESHGHQYIETLLFHEVAAYDPNLAPIIDLFLQRANKQTKFREIFICAP